MSRRLFSTTFLSFALLFGQGGTFLIAALCPHLRTGVMRCDARGQGSVMDHHQMVDMEMEPQSGELPNNLDVTAFNLLPEKCGHCSVHSGSTSSSGISIRHIEASKRATDLTVPLLLKSSEPMVIQVLERLTEHSHSPPGDTISRYILIDVFRI